MSRRVRILRATMVAAAITLLLGSVAGAAVLCVKTTGNDSNNGSSWSLAKLTIGAAITAAQDGDDVWVAAGTYTQALTLAAGVSLYGGFPADGGEWEARNPVSHETILDPSATCVLCTGTETSHTRVIDGFTIIGHGWAVQCQSSAAPTIRKNKIWGTMFSNMGGIRCSSAWPAILNNTILCSTRSIECLSSQDQPLVIRGNVMIMQGEGVYCNDSSPTIANNTIYDVDAGIQGDGGGAAVQCVNNSSPTIYNNIFSSLTYGKILREDRTGTRPLSINKNFMPQPSNSHDYYEDDSQLPYQDLPGTGTYVYPGVSPYFLYQLSREYEENPDLRLLPTSTCVDAGADDGVVEGETDRDGCPRIFGEHVDIGAYEFSGFQNVGVIRGVGSGSLVFQGLVTAMFTSSMFLESGDRSVGVKVTEAPSNVSVGDRVLVAGDVSVVDGIKQVELTSDVFVMSHNNPLPELGMRCRDVGGTDYGPCDPGVTNGRGPLNVGLLVTLQGMVTYRDTAESPAFFYIWDGSNMYISGEIDPRPLDDGSGHFGVRVADSGWISGLSRAVVPWQDFVTVNGIVGVNQAAVSGSTIPEILPKSVTVETQFATVDGDSMMNDPYNNPNGGEPMNDSIGPSLVQTWNLWGCPAQPAASGTGVEPVWAYPDPSTNPMPWWPSVVFDGNDWYDTGDNQLYRWENAKASQVLYGIWAPDDFGGIVQDDGYWIYLGLEGWSVSFSGLYPTIPQWYAVPRIGTITMGCPQNHDVDIENIQIHDGGSVKSYRDADQDGAGWITSTGFWWNNGIQTQATVDLWDRWPDGGNGLRPWHGYYFDAPTANKAWIIP